MRTLLFVAIVMANLSLSAQKLRPSKSSLKGTEKACITGTCCDEPAEAGAASLTDAAFMVSASTTAFSALHLAPEEFVLENPKGGMTLFSCSDGLPGMAYQIKAVEPTNDYLIVIQEWWGLNDHIKQEADNFYTALDGKVNVLAVDLYDGKIAPTPDSARKLIMAALQSNRKETILKGAIASMGKKARIYTVGWCFGGMMSLQAALLAGNKTQACVMYYGTPEKDAAKLKKLHGDVLGIFGTRDASIPNETVDAFASQMKALGKTFILQRYDAPHAFANPSNPAYNAEFRADAFARSVAFLKERMELRK